MSAFSFKDQEDLFNIATQILEDYEIAEWSFGGGTALSAVYYQHRMSYDIDIFSEDFSAITRLIDNRIEIGSNLGIGPSLIEASSSGVTFIVSDSEHQLKLDFLYSDPLTETSYQTESVFGHENIIVQTPFEIIAKKMKNRDILTIRDFVDFAYAEKTEQVVSKIKKSGIIDIERFIEIWRQFNNFDDNSFNLELKYLNPIFMKSKSCIENILYTTFNPSELISIATDENNEFLSCDIWIEEYREAYEDVGEYNLIENIDKALIADILQVDPSTITYNHIYELSSQDIITIKKAI